MTTKIEGVGFVDLRTLFIPQLRLYAEKLGVKNLRTIRSKQDLINNIIARNEGKELVPQTFPTMNWEFLKPVPLPEEKKGGIIPPRLNITTTTTTQPIIITQPTITPRLNIW